MRSKSILILLTLLFLTSCTLGGRGTATPATPIATASPVSSPTTAGPLVILVLPSDMPKADYDQYQTLIYDLAQAAGMRFQVRNVLTPDDVAFEGPALKVVIVLPPDPGLAALSAAAPGVQFLAVGISGLPTAANLSTIGASGVPADQEGFLAGYIAGMVAPEWRVGVLSQKDTTGGEAARNAFGNGFHFFCGACLNPNFTQPYAAGMYPIIVRIPTDAPKSDYTGYANILLQNFVKVAYVYPAIATPDLLNYMAQNGLLVISQTMPGDSVKSQWVASIQPDVISAIKKLFPDLVAGKGGQVLPTPIFLTDVNTDLLGEGKLQKAQEVLDGLQNGTIGTGVAP
jgi:hypothetical protein